MNKEIELRNNESGMHVWISGDKVFVNPAVGFYHGPGTDMVEPCTEGHHVASITSIDECGANWRLEFCSDWLRKFFHEYYHGDDDGEDLDSELMEHLTRFDILAEVMGVLEEEAYRWFNFPELADSLNARITGGEFDHLEGEERDEAITRASFDQLRKVMRQH